MELVLMVLAFVLAIVAVKSAVTYACNDWTAEERFYQRRYRRAVRATRKRNRREAMKLQSSAIKWGTAIDTAVREAREGEAR